MAALPNSKIQYVSSALWAAVAAYPGAGAVAAGALCTNTANSPAVGSERVFVCTVGGVSLGTAPTFTNTKGALTQEGVTGVFWQECTGQPGVNGDITNSPVWASNSTVVLGQIIYDSGTASLQIAGSSFTTHNGAAPTFSATAGVTSTGQDVGNWTSLGLASAFSAGAAPHARRGNADAATWQTVVPAKIFIDSNHAETAAATNTVSGQSTPGAPNQYLSVTMSGSMPPTSCTTGGSIATTGAFSIIFTGNNSNVGGYEYNYGLTYSAAGGGANAGKINLSAQAYNEANVATYDSCTFKLATTSAAQSIGIGGTPGNTASPSVLNFLNSSFIFGSTGQHIVLSYANLLFAGCNFALSGSVPSTLFYLQAPTNVDVTVRDCDLSALTGSLVTFNNLSYGNTGGRIRFQNCKLNASVTMLGGSFSNAGDLTIELHNCDSGSLNYRFYMGNYLGSMVYETTNVRTGGATDGVTPLSWNITPTSKALFGQPFSTEYLPIVRYNTLTSSTHTVTIYINTDATLTNGNFWAELECLDNASFPIGTIVTSRVADPLTATSALTSDTSTWASAKANKYKIVLTFSPAMAGVIKVRLFAATGLTTPIYVDPNVIIDSLTSARQYLLPGMGYANAEAASGGTVGYAYSS